MLIGLPRGLIGIIIGHCAAAADGQYAVGGERPCGVFTAVTGGDFVHSSFSLDICDTVLLGVRLCVGVCSDRERYIVAGIKEDVRADAGYAVGDVERYKLGISLEDILAHAGECAVFADSYLAELGAVVEGIAVNSGDGVGNDDASQTAVAECAPADALKLRACLKADAVKLSAAEEVELADVGDILTEHDLPELVLVGLPRGLVGIIIGHCAAAADGQYTVGG